MASGGEKIDDIPANLLQRKCIVCGYLYKKRPEKKLLQEKFQKRWCVIDDGIFYYYATDSDKKQKNSFYLFGYRFKRLSHNDYRFILTGDKLRSFEFIANSAEDLARWKKGIQIFTERRDSDKTMYSSTLPSQSLANSSQRNKLIKSSTVEGPASSSSYPSELIDDVYARPQKKTTTTTPARSQQKTHRPEQRIEDRNSDACDYIRVDKKLGQSMPERNSRLKRIQNLKNIPSDSSEPFYANFKRQSSATDEDPYLEVLGEPQHESPYSKPLLHKNMKLQAIDNEEDPYIEVLSDNNQQQKVGKQLYQSSGHYNKVSEEKQEDTSSDSDSSDSYYDYSHLPEKDENDWASSEDDDFEDYENVGGKQKV